MKKLLFFLLFLTACTSGGGTFETPELTGENGVLLTLVDAPELVYTGEEVALTYEIYNNGAYSITKGEPGVLIPSIDKLYFSYSDFSAKQDFKKVATGDGNVPFWLDGRDEYVDGERTFVTLFYNAQPIDRNSAGATTPILLTMCYPYQSNITSSVCIEQTRQQDSGTVACSNTPVSPPSPAAPIGIEKIVTRNIRVTDDSNSPGEIVPSFRITLRNYGAGVASTAKCKEPGELNKVKVNAFLLDTPLKCLNDGIATFTRGQAQITCSVDLENSNLDLRAGRANFISLLSINAEYTYRESARTEVRILNE